MRVAHFVGPLTVGAAVWCAVGTITVAAPDAAAVRLALPAAWWVFPFAVAMAACLPAWRRHPLLAAPALLSTLSWWPMALPPIALLWTGPLAWMPIALAFVCAIGCRPLARFGALRNLGPRRSMMLAGVATFLLGAMVAWHVASHLPSGDEPHYLVITQSLLKDHDLRIENNHRQADYAEYFGGDLAPHFVARGKDGEIYSIHAPGLPALVLPAFALYGYRGVKIFLLILSGLTGALVWRIGWKITGEAAAAWFAWTAIVGSSTFLLNSFAVFPDGPGALIVATVILLALCLDGDPQGIGTGAILFVSILLALLPWLHTRFAVLAGGFGALILWQLLVDTSRPSASRLRRAAIFLIIPVAGACAWFGFFEWIYGTPNPAAPYGGAAGTKAAYIPGGLVGLLFDQQFGLVAYAPVLALTVVGLRRLPSASRRAGFAAAAVAGAYLAAVATYWLWWAGSPANPARFVMAVLPACAVSLAMGWQSARPALRRLLIALLGVSLATSAIVVGVNSGDLAWNMRNAEAAWLAWLGPVVNLPRGWPSFFWAVDPDALRTELPFGLHVFVAVALFVVAWRVILWLARTRSWSASTWRLALSVWLLGCFALATQTGWWLNNVTGLDPTPSQVAVLSSVRPVTEIASLHVARLASLAGHIQIESEDLGRTDGPAPWLLLESVPPGTYALHLSTSRPRAGQLKVLVGRGDRPVETHIVQPLSQQTMTMVLPAGAEDLSIVPSKEIEGLRGYIVLEPTHLERGAALARVGLPYGSTDVFFMDDRAFVESGGFWVRGGSAASVVLLRPQDDASGSFSVTLQNGPVSNVVDFATGVTKRTEHLAASERRTVQLMPDGAGTLHLTVSSASGFRPSDGGGSRDSRYLGVWVEVR